MWWSLIPAAIGIGKAIGDAFAGEEFTYAGPGSASEKQDQAAQAWAKEQEYLRSRGQAPLPEYASNWDDEAYNRAVGAYGGYDEALGMYRDAASGKTPSKAEILAQQYGANAAGQNIGMARSANPRAQAASMYQALQQNQKMQATIAGNAAALRADEMERARAGLAGVTNAKFGASGALLGAKDQRSMFDQKGQWDRERLKGERELDFEQIRARREGELLGANTQKDLQGERLDYEKDRDDKERFDRYMAAAAQGLGTMGAAGGTGSDERMKEKVMPSDKEKEDLKREARRMGNQAAGYQAGNSEYFSGNSDDEAAAVEKAFAKKGVGKKNPQTETAAKTAALAQKMEDDPDYTRALAAFSKKLGTTPPRQPAGTAGMANYQRPAAQPLEVAPITIQGQAPAQPTKLQQFMNPKPADANLRRAGLDPAALRPPPGAPVPVGRAASVEAPNMQGAYVPFRHMVAANPDPVAAQHSFVAGHPRLGVPSATRLVPMGPGRGMAAGAGAGPAQAMELPPPAPPPLTPEMVPSYRPPSLPIPPGLGMPPDGGIPMQPPNGVVATTEMSDIRSKSAAMPADEEWERDLAEKEKRRNAAVAAYAGGRSQGGSRPFEGAPLEGPSGGALSDERGKEAKGRPPVEDFMAKADGYTYEYKDPRNGDGMPKDQRFMGPMAQDLARVKDIGPTLTQPGPDGMLRVDTDRLSLANTAAVAHLYDRLRHLEQKKGAARG